MNLFEWLKREQAPTDYQKSKEALYFSKHSLRLSSLDPFRYLSKASTPFDVIRANIVLRSLENKETIERRVEDRFRAKENTMRLSFEEFLSSVESDLPYFEKDGWKNYVPIFPSSLAKLYSNNADRLLKEPFKRLFRNYSSILIDPFDFYGYELFDSYFTSLVPISKKKRGMAAYDFDACRLYFINDEGRLDEEVALFDKRLMNASKSHLSTRLKKAAEAYYAFDKDAFLQTLLEESLISSSLIREIAKEGDPK